MVLSTNRSRVASVLRNDPDVARTLGAATGTFTSDIHRRTADGPLEMTFGHVLHTVDLSTGKTLSRINGAVIIRVRMSDTIYAFLGEWPSKGATGEAFLVRAREQMVRTPSESLS